MTPILGIPVYNNHVAGATYENVKIQGLGPWLPTDSVDVWFVKTTGNNHEYYHTSMTPASSDNNYRQMEMYNILLSAEENNKPITVDVDNNGQINELFYYIVTP